MPPRTKARRNYKKKPMRRYKSKGLTKTETKQVKAIAKKTINGMAESKYFDVRSIFELQGGPSGVGLELVDARVGEGHLRVLGFATGTAARLDGLTSYKYGYEATPGNPAKSIQALQMGRVFDRGSTNDVEKAQSIIGQYVNPSFAQSEWNLQRLPINADTIQDRLTAQLAGIPYQLRIIRVCPRVKKGSYQEVDPKYDLFVDQYGVETGIESTNFNQYQLMMYKVNTRKYMLKADIMPRMTAPLIANSVWDPPNPNGITTQVQQVNQSSSMLNYKFKHDIGKKLYYSDPETVFTPSDGFKPEFVFFHVVPIGGQNTPNVAQHMGDLRICCKAVSTFKDI